MTNNEFKLKSIIFNAIIALLDFNITEYKGLDDEEFIEFICDEVGIHKDDYKELMKLN